MMKRAFWRLSKVWFFFFLNSSLSISTLLRSTIYVLDFLFSSRVVRKKGIHFKIGKSRDTFCRTKKRRPFGGGGGVMME